MTQAGTGALRATVQLTHAYEPRGVARDLFADRSDEILLAGPAGTGKSRACLEKLNLAMLVNPGAAGLIVRQVRDTCTSTALATFREHVIPELIQSGDVSWYGGSAQESPQYRYSNGSIIRIGGLDKPSKIMSSDYDMIYVQEATELTVSGWMALTTRLRHGTLSFQQLIADCNPSFPTHWLKLRADSGVTKMYESRHEDNPILFNSDGTKTVRGKAYIAKLDALTGVDHLRLRKGLWVAAEGMIYAEEFQPAVHIVPKFEIPKTWRRFWTVDFGYVHPFVLQMWAEDPDGRLYLYREIYHTHRTVDEHARKAIDLCTDAHGNWTESKPELIICDHDAEDRATLARSLGMGTIAAKKTVSDGIQAVKRRMRIEGDGKPRIFIFESACVEIDASLVDARKPTCTADEIPGYIWKGVGKEEPVKENDDGMDALRYMVAQKDLHGEPRIRWLS